MIEDLGVGGMRFVQSDALFKFGTDAVLLAQFCRLKKNAKVCDLGTGTGILPVLLSGMHPGVTVDGVEIQSEAVRTARENVRLNSLEETVRIIERDLRQLEGVLCAGGYDAVVCNPPYMKVGHGRQNARRELLIARSEAGCTLREVCRAAARLLRTGGLFFIVHRPERLCDLMCALREAELEPKRLRTVHSDGSRPPSLVLCESRRGGAAGLKIEAPFYNRPYGKPYSLKEREE